LSWPRRLPGRTIERVSTMRSGSRLRASQRALSAQCRGAVITALC